MRYSNTNGVEAYEEVTSQQLPRFQLLNILIDCILESRKTVAEEIPNMATSVSFNILGLTGAFLGAYLDPLASMSVGILLSLKIWTFITLASLVDNDCKNLAVK